MQVRACEPEVVPAHSLTYLLIDPVLPFRLRIRQSEKIGDGKKQLRAAVLFSHLLPGQTTVLSSRRWVWGRLVYVAGLRLEDGDLLIVIASDSPSTMITDYAHRWGIETCGMQVAACEPELLPARSATLFGIFKTSGFCLESTHFTEPERLSKLAECEKQEIPERVPVCFSCECHVPAGIDSGWVGTPRFDVFGFVLGDEDW